MSELVWLAVSLIVSRHCGPQFASSSYLLNTHYRPGTILNTLVRICLSSQQAMTNTLSLYHLQVSKGRYKGAHVRSGCLSVEPKLICEHSLRSSSVNCLGSETGLSWSQHLAQSTQNSFASDRNPSQKVKRNIFHSQA